MFARYVVRQDNAEEAISMNVVSLVGNLATDVDLKELSAEKKVANFTLAVDRPGKDAGADFIRIATWDRQAELCAQYLAKGRQIALDGRIRSRSWEEDGKRRSAIEVVANRVQFLSTPASREEVPFAA